MPHTDILNCSDSELWPILDSDEPHDNKRWLLCKGIGTIELCKLGEMLDIDSYENLKAAIKLVGEPRDDGPWPQAIPAALTQRLAAMTDDEIDLVARRWVEVQELRGASTIESLTDYLKRLRSYLSGRSGDFFLVEAL